MQQIRVFKQSGHLVADLDPLKLESSSPALKHRIHGYRWQKTPQCEDVNLGDISLWQQKLSSEEIDAGMNREIPKEMDRNRTES